METMKPGRRMTCCLSLNALRRAGMTLAAPANELEAMRSGARDEVCAELRLVVPDARSRKGAQRVAAHGRRS